jgi:hypothetical protein
MTNGHVCQEKNIEWVTRRAMSGDGGQEMPGWTWGRFCEEAGYDQETPIEWFKKYKLPWTQIAGSDIAENEVGKPTSPKILKKQTKPDAHFTVAEISREIASGEVSDNDLLLPPWGDHPTRTL